MYHLEFSRGGQLCSHQQVNISEYLANVRISPMLSITFAHAAKVRFPEGFSMRAAARHLRPLGGGLR